MRGSRARFAPEAAGAPVMLGGYMWAYNSALLDSIPKSWRDAEVSPAILPDEEWRHWSVALLALCSGKYREGAATEGSRISDELELGLEGDAIGPEPTAVPEDGPLRCLLPAGFAADEGAWRDFINGDAAAMPVTQREVRRLQALSDQGKGVDWRLAASGSGFTDQALYISVVRQAEGEKVELCRAFARSLLSEESQGELHRIGAFSATGASAGYMGNDPLAAMEGDASLTTRLDALHRAGRSGRWGRIAQMAEQYRALAEKSAPKRAQNGADPTFETGLGAKNSQNRHRSSGLTGVFGEGPVSKAGPSPLNRLQNIPEGISNGEGVGAESRPSPYEVGRLLAAAYPERVAKALPEGRGHFQLATGERAAVAPEDALSACEWLAVASLSVRPGGEGRIFLAAPVDPEDLPELIRTRDRVAWDGKAGAATARRERRIGSLLVDAKPLSEGVREQLTQAICEAAQKDGPAMLDFSDEVGNLQRRVAAVAAWHPELELPDLSTEAVLRTAPDWLPPFVGRATTVAELK